MKKKIILVLALFFTCFLSFVACKKDKEVVYSKDMREAMNYVKDFYTITKDVSNFTGDQGGLRTSFPIGTGVTASYSVSVTEGNNDDVVVVQTGDTYKIDINNFTDHDIKFTVTITLKLNDETGEIEWNCKYDKFVLKTWAEYASAEKGETVATKGVVVAIDGTNHNNFYFKDNDGGYYAYDAIIDGNKTVEIGQTIICIGTKTLYNKAYEITPCTVYVQDDEKQTVTYKDITNEVKTFTSSEDTKFANYQSTLVKLSAVTILNVDGKYLWFKLLNNSGDELKGYVYFSSSTVLVTDAEMTAMKNFANKGITADIYGIGFMYNSTFQIIPTDAKSVDYALLPEVSDSEKLDYIANNGVKALENYEILTNIELPPTYKYNSSDITCTWNIESEYLDATGKVIKYPNEDTEVTLTGTLTLNEATKDIQVKVIVKALSRVDVDSIVSLYPGEATYALVVGKVVSCDKDSKNFYLADNTGCLYAYNANSLTNANIAVGDTVKVVGYTTLYTNTNKQYTRELSVVKFEKVTEEVTYNVVDLDITEVCGKSQTETLSEDQLAEFANSEFFNYVYRLTGYLREGTVGNNTNYYLCDSLEGEATNGLVYYYKNAGINDDLKALLGKKVTMVVPMMDWTQSGYRLGAYVSVAEYVETTPVEDTTIRTIASVKEQLITAAADIKENNVPVKAKVKGVIVSNDKAQGVVIEDATGGIFVYTKTCTLKPGDVVIVEGEMAYYGGPQLKNPTFTVLSVTEKGYNFVGEEKTTEEMCNNTVNDACKKFVVTGTVVVNDKGYVSIQGAEKSISIYCSVADKAALTALVGKKVTINCVAYNTKAPGNVLLVSFTEVTEA